MQCICSNYGCTHFFFFKSNQTLIILVSLNSLLYRNVVASGRARPRGLAPGQRSSKETSQRPAVASRWRHCADLAGRVIKPRTSRTDSVRLATELKHLPKPIMAFTAHGNNSLIQNFVLI